jgi:NAD-dependent DNA ligase
MGLARRAEVLMPRSGFTALNRVRVERGDEPFANPRHAEVTPLAGKTFVFTTTLDAYTRDEAQAAVEARGGRATSDISGEIAPASCSTAHRMRAACPFESTKRS